jgi:hypothetical protein
MRQRPLAEPPPTVPPCPLRSWRECALCSGTGDVEQVPFSVIDFLQVSVITDRLNALLQGNHFVIAGHHHHGPKLQPLARCMVLIETYPLVSRILNAMPASFTAARARSS